MTIPKFWPKPIPRLFLRYQIFRNRNRDFFLRPNFSETDTFLPRSNFPKPKPRLFSETKFSEADTVTLQKLAKVPRPPRPWPKPKQDFSISLKIFGEIFHKSFPPFPSLFFFSPTIYFSSPLWTKLRYESSTLILNKELSSTIFQNCQSVSQSVRHR